MSPVSQSRREPPGAGTDGAAVATRPLPVSRRLAVHAPRVDARSTVVAAVACAVTAIVVALLYSDVKIGLVVLMGLCFLPLAFLRPPLAACVWLVLQFFSRVSGLSSIPDHLVLLLLACLLGVLVGRRGRTAREAFGDSRGLIAVAVAFVMWELLTLAWAPSAGAATQTVKDLSYAAVGMLVVLGTITERRHVRWLAIAFVVGATLTVLYGAARGGFHASGASAVTDTDGRLQAGEGDPNYLAAVLVPAIMLAVGLAVRRSTWQRIALGAAVIVMAIGLAATQSRGGLIAAGVAALGALAIWRGRRVAVGSLIVLAAGATAGYFAASPSAWHRIHAGGNTGSGRTDIWTIAWRVVHDHPFFGVGLAQFPQVSPTYVRRPGSLTYVAVILDDKIVVHNVYLQLWAETGIVGLVLFLAVIGASLVGSWRACVRFDSQRDPEMLALARMTLLAMLGMLAASFFLSDNTNRQTWVLLALGPALAGIAVRRRRAEAAALEEVWWPPGVIAPHRIPVPG